MSAAQLARTGRAAAALVAAALILGLGPGGCSKRVLETPSGAGARGPRTIVHQVGPGETLALIADNYYGDPGRAGQIATDNGIQDPEQLAIGSSLVLRFSKPEWEVARRRAAAMKPYNRGVDFLEEERLAAAENEFRDALAIAPDFLNARYNLALVQMQRGRLDEAEAILAELVSIRPQDRDFLFAHGHVLFLQTRLDEAVAELRRLLTLDPRHRRGAYALARALQASERTAEAIAAWQAYLQLDDTSAWAEEARRNLRQLQGE
jgi:tetratricopeptide (TPR) repeat protein